MEYDFSWTPEKDQLKKLEDMNFELPSNLDDVVWFLESSGYPLTVTLKWLPKTEIEEYIGYSTFVGMSAGGTIEHFRVL